MIIIVDNTIGTRTNYRDMIIECLKKNKIKHVLVRTAAELVAEINDDGKKFRGIILTGSTVHVPDMSAQQYQMNLAAVRSGLPVLGICFGSQFICEYLGGSIERMPRLVCDSRMIRGSSGQMSARFCARYRLARIPPECKVLYVATINGITDAPVAFQHRRKPIYGTLFHPEYHPHTQTMITHFSRTGTI